MPERRLTIEQETMRQTVSEAIGEDVEPNLYDIGYWARVAGLACPDDFEMQSGWIEADDELEGIPEDTDAAE